MSVAEDRDITVPLAALAAVAPREWAQFKIAYVKYVERIRDEMMKASLDELQRSQGRAQNANALRCLFDDAVTAANRMSERTKR